MIDQLREELREARAQAWANEHPTQADLVRLLDLMKKMIDLVEDLSHEQIR